ncbi:MAG: NADH:ubiquinone reductase (Na(+)-transporting) subunit C [Bacteroidales bacterium]|nr:NADH:ubiquinone reductase (Na(+)-transporting) subunit C [Bacteroidales bacterium]MDY0217151.1 NADH:ubiquinone reductase (Na(+)-transporting) subunit C [Bacteroidales bacterium]
MFSNKYIFIYSSVLVIVVAVLLALAATLLKPAQENNVKTEKMQQILQSAGIESPTKETISIYHKYITNELIINIEGEILSDFAQGEFIKGNERAFDLNLKEELRKLSGKTPTPKDVRLPLFVLMNDQKDTLFIIPLIGKGLWGPVWGNIALKSDKNTVAGVTFGHKSETPGLGAEISTPTFQNQFLGKQIFDENGDFTSIKVVKGGVANSSLNPIHGVDAISGGTITSKGVNNMLEICLKNYESFLKTK